MRDQKLNDQQREDLKKRKILFVEDDPLVLDSLSIRLEDEGYYVVAVNNGAAAISVASSEPNFDLIIADVRMPEIDGIETIKQVKQILPRIKSMLITAYADYEAPIRAIDIDVDKYLTKPFDDQDFLSRVKNLILRKEIEEAEQEYHISQQKRVYDFDSIIGRSQPILEVLNNVKMVADNKVPVLLLGETGTGKELIAQAIHVNGVRKERPLIKVNCAALPANLAESDLFGHVRGAFTGAFVRKIGRFELANGGTIFLDEVGDLSLDLQAKLLRVLQKEEFERVGDPNTIKVDVRVIAATNRNLEEAIRNGNFREDLYYRLKVFQIVIPPLRERKEDIPLITEHFIKKYSTELNKKPHVTKIEDSAMELLRNNDWKGNIRELESVIQCAVIVAANGIIQVKDLRLPQSLNKILSRVGKKSINQKAEWLRPMREVIKKHIELVLSECPTKAEAARILKLPPATLNDWIIRYKVKLPLHLKKRPPK